MAVKQTKKLTYVKLSESRIQEIKQLVHSWPYETKAFMRARLNQFAPPSYLKTLIKKYSFILIGKKIKRNFKILTDPDILTDWQMRFEISGESNPYAAWNKILEKEIDARDYTYILSLLDAELIDIHIPHELKSLFRKIYKAHIRKEYLTDTSIPRAPLILITGTSGSGKTATIEKTIEKIIFQNEIRLEVDLKQKKDKLLTREPFWRRLEDISSELAIEIEQKKRLKRFKFLSHTPIIKSIFKKKIGRNLSELEEQGILVDHSVITPNDYQTAYSGEPGNFFRKAMGHPKSVSIRHIEEAHSAFGKASGREASSQQQRTLIDSSNIILDEIINGRRNCLLIASSDQPEKFDHSIYRRFVERGLIIDISEYWTNPENIREIIKIELARNKIFTDTRTENKTNIYTISNEDLTLSVNKIITIFKDRTLRITPSYLRKLVQSIIDIKEDLKPEYFDEGLLVRKAFELVAKNAYGDLYAKVVDKMDRDIKWTDYIGDVKNELSEMSNNCLRYNVDEEKGVVLNGPPGSGKTFLVRCWLSDNKSIHDISASPNDLFDPQNPYDGAVDNLEKIYDIAKMLVPSVVFFDEGDSIAPTRSQGGGQPSDKLTNKFLNIIDGETPLKKVFTVLTTNRLDIIDPALIRSKRLKVLDISGHLRHNDIINIINKRLENIPLAEGLDINKSVENASTICNTPADFTAYIEKALSLRNTEYTVLKKIQDYQDAPEKVINKFIQFNYKTLNGILKTLHAPKMLRSTVSSGFREFLIKFPEVTMIVDDIKDEKDYPLTLNHLRSAKQELSDSPVTKGKHQLDDFLEAELSQEPQVGFIIGVGASDVAGVLLPIATSLIYNFNPEKVLVTGAVSSATTSQLEMAVKMTQQSAQEALTMVKNYLQYLLPKVDMSKTLGIFLDKITIHHQLLSASYNVGGPSAGYALAINTISAILQIPVYNDFGITGAPWTKGTTKEKIGGSVIIGGHKKKTEKVLLHLRRMFMPLQNYTDFEREILAGYWERGKDILAVSNFGDLMPEVLLLEDGYNENLEQLIRMRIEYKIKRYRGETSIRELKKQIPYLRNKIKDEFEKEVVKRISNIYKYIKDSSHDPYLSHTEILSGNIIDKKKVDKESINLQKRFGT